MRVAGILGLCAFAALSFSVADAKSSRIDELREQADQHYQNADYHKARKDYDDLAEMGDKFAQYRLSVIHLEGLGVPENVVEAFAWSALAAEADHKALKQYRDTVWELVPGEHRKKAKSRAKRLSGRYGDLALARKHKRTLTKNLRSCTGSRLGTSCEFVQSSRPAGNGVTPGTAAERGAFAALEAEDIAALNIVNGAIVNPQTGTGGANTANAGRFPGAETHPDYYMELRRSLEAFNRIIDDHASGYSELGEFEVLEDDEPSDS